MNRKIWIGMVLLLHPIFGATEEPERVYLAADDHTDYYWSADGERYKKAFIDMIDYYLDLADQTQKEPPDFQSRFACDGSFWLWVYQHEKTPDEFNRLLSRIRSGHISIPLNPLACTYGAQPTEAVIRSFYYSGQIQRQYNIDFPLAIAMENQTLPWGLSSLWAGSGAKYSWKGICGCATRIPDAGDREHDIYYYTGPDGQKVLMKWNSMLKDNQGMGGYAEARRPELVFRYVTSDPSFQVRYPYRVIGCFGQGWDDLETRNDEIVKAARALSDANHRAIVSNEVDFFEDFEKTYGDQIPFESRSYGNEWDLLWASLAEVSGEVKRSVETLRTAEAMAVLICQKHPEFWQRYQESEQQAFMNLGLFYEHDLTADGPVSRKQRELWQREMANGFVSYVNQLHSDSLRVLGEQIPCPAGAQRFFVFNPLGWARSDAATLSFPSNKEFHVVDIDAGRDVPFQYDKQNGTLQIWAEDVPAVGYKVYEIRDGKGREFENPVRIQGQTVENEFYSLSFLGNGAISGWKDKKRADREWGKEINNRRLNDFGYVPGSYEFIDQGPVSVSVRTVSDSPIKKITTLTFYGHSDRIDITNEIQQNFSDVQTVAFAFNIEEPTVRHEELGVIATAKSEKEGGHYSDRNARYDWMTFNHFADMTGKDSFGVTVSNADCLFFQSGNSSLKTLDSHTPVVTALIGGQVDGRNLGIQDQGGDRRFLSRFALRAHDGYDAASAMRFSLEHQNPLTSSMITGTTPVLPERYQGIEISNPDVLLWAFKPSEADNGKSVAMRLWNLTDTEQSADIQLPSRSIQHAWSTTHIETKEQPLPVSPQGIRVTFAKQQIRTIRIREE